MGCYLQRGRALKRKVQIRQADSVSKTWMRCMVERSSISAMHTVQQGEYVGKRKLQWVRDVFTVQRKLRVLYAAGGARLPCKTGWHKTLYIPARGHRRESC